MPTNLLLHNQTFRDSKIVFTFNDIMTKGKFEELTGIHLSELIEKTTGEFQHLIYKLQKKEFGNNHVIIWQTKLNNKNTQS